jgi:hypothetical protein
MDNGSLRRFRRGSNAKKLIMVIINPGSENKGGTFAQALINAAEWLESIHNEGFTEVEMSFVKRHKDGDWQFNFTHKVTGKVAILKIHGFTKEQRKSFVFNPRVYWNGSSTSDPKIEDWLTDDYTYRIIYEKKAKS